jgi:hypothetical protein
VPHADVFIAGGFGDEADEDGEHEAADFTLPSLCDREDGDLRVSNAVPVQLVTRWS